jgi:amidase
MTPLHFRSATAIAAAIRSGEITARAALEHFLDRVDQHNGPLNAVIYQDREGARARAGGQQATSLAPSMACP